MLLLLASVALLLFPGYSIAHPSLSKRACSTSVSAYWPYWLANEQSATDFPWEHVDVGIYFVAPTTEDGFELTGSSYDLVAFVQGAHAANKRATVSIGGWNGSKYFAALTSSRARRERFADKVVQFLEQYSLDGVDIDWEWPYSAGAGDNYHQAADSDNLRRFVKRLRQKLGDDKLITLALPNWGLKGSDGQTIQDNSELAGYVDHIMLMNYDQSGPWSSTTGPNSALYQCWDAASSAESALAFWLGSGVPACKLSLGIPSYGRTFRLASTRLQEREDGSRLYQRLDPDVLQGNMTTYNDMLGVSIDADIPERGINGYSRYWDDCTRTPYLVNYKKYELVAFEDRNSIAKKARYLRDLGIGAVCFYESSSIPSSFYDVARGELD